MRSGIRCVCVRARWAGAANGRTRARLWRERIHNICVHRRTAVLCILQPCARTMRWYCTARGGANSTSRSRLNSALTNKRIRAISRECVAVRGVYAIKREKKIAGRQQWTESDKKTFGRCGRAPPPSPSPSASDSADVWPPPRNSPLLARLCARRRPSFRSRYRKTAAHVSTRLRLLTVVFRQLVFFPVFRSRVSFGFAKFPGAPLPSARIIIIVIIVIIFLLYNIRSRHTTATRENALNALGWFYGLLQALLDCVMLKWSQVPEVAREM